MTRASVADRPPVPRTLRIGSVSYLNARPLIEGLDRRDDVELHLDVPSRLLDGLRGGAFDVALLPVIDYQRMDGIVVVPAGGIGSDGPTLTVRIFSKRPLAEVRTLACDTDSHTSVALARVLLLRHYGLSPAFVDLDADHASADARLLIGDKVVCAEPAGYDHQIDLGQAWKEMTGLPFVFAAWMARGDVADLPRLHARLAESLTLGMARIEPIVQRHAIPRGWPPDLARQYLTRNLQYRIGPHELQAIRTFHRLAHECGVLPDVPRSLDVLALE